MSLSEIERARAQAIGVLAAKLANHARTDCPRCIDYIAAVHDGARPADAVHLRCATASGWAAEIGTLVAAGQDGQVADE